MSALRDLPSLDSIPGFANAGSGLDQAGVATVQAIAARPREPLPAAAQAQALLQTQAMHQLFQQGRHNEAFQRGHQALAHWHALQDHARACEVLHVLSWACLEHEQGVEALALARHCLRLARMRVLPASLVKALALLAVLHARLHDVAVAENLALQALSRARDLHQRLVQAQVLDALLMVLLETHAAHLEADDPEALQATTLRLRRHANHALAHSGPQPGSFIELQLRIRAGAALIVCGRALDALHILDECTQIARQSGFDQSALWARLHSAQASMHCDHDAAALAAVQLLAPTLDTDAPPRLRLAVTILQSKLAKRAGANDRAAELRAAASAQQAPLLRQRKKLRATLRRSADDLTHSLSTLDQDWQEGGPARHPGSDAEGERQPTLDNIFRDARADSLSPPQVPQGLMPGDTIDKQVLP